MSRYAAFLRAINVGGHTVKMEDLRAIFSAQGFTHVETFIASGNVLFDAPAGDPAGLEEHIARTLRASLGYEVATFLRTGTELAEILACSPFSESQMTAAAAFNIGFLAAAPSPEVIHKLLALQNEIDTFATGRREVYWLCRKKQSESTFSNAVLEKILKIPATLRGISTVEKMTARLQA